MLLTQITGTQCITHRLKEGTAKISILDVPCRIIVQGETAEIITGEELSESGSSPFSGVHVFEDRKKRRCVCIFCRNSSGWDIFRIYRFAEGRITIGSGKADLIRISDSRIPAAAVLLDRETGQITDCSGCGLLAVHNRRVSEAALQDGEQVQILNLRLIPLRQGFLINCPSDIKVQGGEVFSPQTRNTFIGTSGSGENSGREELPARIFQEDLAVPGSLLSVRKIPLILSVGPSLTMALASGAGSFFSVQNALLNGRDLMDLMPMILMPAGMIAGALIWMPAARVYERISGKRDRKHRISSYREYLADMKQRIRSCQERYADAVQILFPEDPCAGKMWQSVPGSREFLCFPAGWGSENWDIRLNASFHIPDSDPLYQMIRDVQNECFVQEKALIIRSLAEYETVWIAQSEEGEAFMIRMMITLLWNHSPEYLSAGILCSEEWENDHFWIRLLPHLKTGRGRRICRSEKELLPSDVPDETEMIWFVYDEEMRLMIPSGKHRTIVLCRRPPVPGSREALFLIGRESAEMRTFSSVHRFSPVCAETDTWKCALRMHREMPYERRDLQSPDFFRLSRAAGPADLEIPENWRRNRTYSHISTAIGTDRHGDLISIDLHESGMGPHGLIAGMTGSGKSELILTILLGLAVRYSPRELQFVLIDFKGGGALQALSFGGTYIPHLSSVLTNLNENAFRRAIVSFSNECRRRETLLNRASEICGRPVVNADDYQRLWEKEWKLPFLPHLIILVDEFAELKKTCPDFLKELMTLARIGRSLGLHLILSTQKPGGVVDEQTWSNIRLRICLKVRDPQDSSEMLHCRDAADLHQPGEFIMQYDGYTVRGRCGYASAPLRNNDQRACLNDAGGRSVYESRIENGSGLNEAAVTVRALIQYGAAENAAVRKIWMDELKELHAEDAEKYPPGSIGILDDYIHGRQPVLKMKDSFPGMAVIASDRASRRSFVRCLIFQLLGMDRNEDEYCLLDDTGRPPEWAAGCPGMIGYGSAGSSDLIRNLYRHLSAEDRNKRGICYVIITDYSFAQMLEENVRILLRRMMEQAENLKAYFIIMAAGMQMFPYRDLALFSERIALKQDSTADLSAFFETGTRLTCSGRGTGLIRRSEVMEFSYFLIRDDEMQARIQKVRENRNSWYHLPEIPDPVSLENCTGSGIPAGFSREAYEMRILNSRILIVIATYDEELDELYEVYRKYPQWETIRNPEEGSEIKGDLKPVVLMFSLDCYLASAFYAKRNAWPILYAGEGFHDQYHFTAGKKVRISAGQGLLIQRGKCEVIQLAGK